MKTLTLMPLIFALGMALTAKADSGDVDTAALFKASLHGQSSLQAKPLLQLAQGTAEVDVCLGKCEEELNSCRDSGKDESECGDALGACQQACEEQG